MNIYLSHSGAYDYENELYKPLKASELFKSHTVFLPHEPENRRVAAKAKFKTTDLLVAEVSYPSTGQGIELGLASAANVPVVCFYKSGTKPSGSLRFVADKVIEYTDSNELIAKLQLQLRLRSGVQ
jgi:hypothetical protein